MRIKVRDLKCEVTRHEGIIPKELIGCGDDEVFEFADNLNVVADASKHGSEVLITAYINGTFNDECSRCLDSVRDSFKITARLHYQVEGQQEYIDILEDLRQEVVVNMPSKILCKQDCKGLCAKCGSNLNYEQCKCGQSK